jgi:MFS superfamily sulfate permease-like transporter
VQVRILRLSANLFFGNVSVFRDEFYRSLAVSPNQVGTTP